MKSVLVCLVFLLPSVTGLRFIKTRHSEAEVTPDKKLSAGKGRLLNKYANPMRWHYPTHGPTYDPVRNVVKARSVAELASSSAAEELLNCSAEMKEKCKNTSWQKLCIAQNMTKLWMNWEYGDGSGTGEPMGRRTSEAGGAGEPAEQEQEGQDQGNRRAGQDSSSAQGELEEQEETGWGPGWEDPYVQEYPGWAWDSSTGIEQFCVNPKGFDDQYADEKECQKEIFGDEGITHQMLCSRFEHMKMPANNVQDCRCMEEKEWNNSNCDTGGCPSHRYSGDIEIAMRRFYLFFWQWFFNQTQCEADVNQTVWEWCVENWTTPGGTSDAWQYCLPKGMCACDRIHSEVVIDWTANVEDWFLDYENQLQVICDSKSTCTWLCGQCKSSTELAYYGAAPDMCNSGGLSVDSACCVMFLATNQKIMDNVYDIFKKGGREEQVKAVFDGANSLAESVFKRFVVENGNKNINETHSYAQVCFDGMHKSAHHDTLRKQAKDAADKDANSEHKANRNKLHKQQEQLKKLATNFKTIADTLWNNLLPEVKKSKLKQCPSN